MNFALRGMSHDRLPNIGDQSRLPNIGGRSRGARRSEDEESSLVTNVACHLLCSALLCTSRVVSAPSQACCCLILRCDEIHAYRLRRVITRVFLYLRGTMHHGLTYKGMGTLDSPPHLQGYCDSDYAEDETDHRSITGYAFLLNGAPMSWTS